MASFMHLFESGSFTPELTGLDDDGSEIRIMKVGGGTLGREYNAPSEAWLAEFVPAGTEEVNRFEIVGGGTHWSVLLGVIEDLNAARIDDTEEWEVQGYYTEHIGWEVLTVCETKADALAEARTYDVNEPGIPHRVRKSRD